MLGSLALGERGGCGGAHKDALARLWELGDAAHDELAVAHLGDAHVDEVLLGEERERVHGDVLVLELPEVQPRQRHVQAAAADLRV